VRLVIDLDLDLLPNDTGKEARRILGFWAGWLPQMDLSRPTEQASWTPITRRLAPCAWLEKTRRTRRTLHNERRRARYRRDWEGRRPNATGCRIPDHPH
jgi:hypothetical protein